MLDAVIRLQDLLSRFNQAIQEIEERKLKFAVFENHNERQIDVPNTSLNNL